MTNQVSPFCITPANLGEAMELAKMISTSSFCPKQMMNKPGDVILTLQMGSELGLSPMQAIQNIAVINGRPSLWGDALLAVAMSSPNYVSHREWTSGDIATSDLVAHCAVTRKNSEEHISTFSMADAKKANLWGKAGPWSQYPARMLQMRARAFALRDKFGDTLRGIQSAEEVSDYQVLESKPKTISKMIKSEPENLNAYYLPPVSEYIDKINDTKSLDDLKAVYIDAMRVFKGNHKELTMLVEAKDMKKGDLEAEIRPHELETKVEKEIDQAGVDEFIAELDEAEAKEK